MSAKKNDAYKRDWTLVPWSAIALVVDVLMFGAIKYERDGWKKLDNADRRYLAAAFRHLTAYAEGEKNDIESGLPHLAHATCCLIFLLAGAYE